MHINTDYLGLKYPLDSFSGAGLLPGHPAPVQPGIPAEPGRRLPGAELGARHELGEGPVRQLPQGPDPAARAAGAVRHPGPGRRGRVPLPGRRIPTTPATMSPRPSPRWPRPARDDDEQPAAHPAGRHASNNKAAYPLTMVIYAMVPTSGASEAKAAAIARFLDFAAGAGQKQGVQPGNLRRVTCRCRRKWGPRRSRSRPRCGPIRGHGHPSPSRGPTSPPARRGGSAPPPSASPSPTPGPGVVTVTLAPGPPA